MALFVGQTGLYLSVDGLEEEALEQVLFFIEGVLDSTGIFQEDVQGM